MPADRQQRGKKQLVLSWGININNKNHIFVLKLQEHKWALNLESRLHKWIFSSRWTLSHPAGPLTMQRKYIYCYSCHCKTETFPSFRNKNILHHYQWYNLWKGKPLTSFSLVVFIEIIHLQTIKSPQQLNARLHWGSCIKENTHGKLWIIHLSWIIQCNVFSGMKTESCIQKGLLLMLNCFKMDCTIVRYVLDMEIINSFSPNWSQLHTSMMQLRSLWCSSYPQE